MWELLASAGQLEALRVLTELWEDARARRSLGRSRRTVDAAGGTVADVLVLPPGYTPAHLDERLAEVG
jgi:hypothetical protein